MVSRQNLLSSTGAKGGAPTTVLSSLPPERTGTADVKDSGDHQRYGSLRQAQGLPDPQPVTVREGGFSGTSAGSCRPAAAKGARIPGSWCFPADPLQDPFQWTEVRPRSPHRQAESRPRCPDRSSHGSITGIRSSICFSGGFGSSTLQRLSGKTQVPGVREACGV